MTRSGRSPAATALALAAVLAAAGWAAGCAGLGLGAAATASHTAAEADALLASGDLAAATAIYERLALSGPEPDRALLMLAVLELDPSRPPYDPSRAFARLERLRAEHAEGPWAAAARALLSLRGQARRLESEVARLGRQLEAIKKIDLDPPDR